MEKFIHISFQLMMMFVMGGALVAALAAPYPIDLAGSLICTGGLVMIGAIIVDIARG